MLGVQYAILHLGLHVLQISNAQKCDMTKSITGKIYI